MPDKELQMHGSMFFLLKTFIENKYGDNAWEKLNQEAGTRTTYGVHENYPACEMTAIIHAVSCRDGCSENEIKEKLGEHLVPALLTMYQSYLNPSWKTFELLENTELVMHKAVRRQENTASPPVLNVFRVHDKLLIIDYYSKRKMACLAVGIRKGIAHFYNESEKVHIIPTTNPDDERVQIRVEFK